MVSSQDTAVAAALTELGEEVDPIVEILDVTPGLPGRRASSRCATCCSGSTARDHRRPGRRRRRRRAAVPGEPIAFVVRRGEEGGDRRGHPRARSTATCASASRPGSGFDFPFRVSVNIADNIGGPSAGLMMSLADLRHPDARLADRRRRRRRHRHHHPAGKVGPIGGIQQKIAAARDAGAELFLVPADNCDGIGGVDPGDMRLARATTMHRAVADPRRLGRRPRRRPPELRGHRVMTTDPTRLGPTERRRLPEDPALAAAVLEIESHVAQDGWDQPARLYALVDTADAGRPGARARGGDGHRRPRRRRLVHPDRAGRAAARPGARGGAAHDRLARRA